MASGRVVALAMVVAQDRPRLVAACDDQSSGSSRSTRREDRRPPARAYDAYGQAKQELSQDDPDRREAALKRWPVTAIPAVDLIADQAQADYDHR